jgi:hypothetical protein
MGQNEFSRIITASAGQATSANIRPGQRLANHVYHRFDVTEDDEYSVPTLGRNAVNLRVNAGVANAARFIPVERVRV